MFSTLCIPEPGGLGAFLHLEGHQLLTNRLINTRPDIILNSNNFLHFVEPKINLIGRLAMAALFEGSIKTVPKTAGSADEGE